MKKIFVLVIVFLIIFVVCGNYSNYEYYLYEGKLKVVIINFIFYDMVKCVGGNKVDVYSIVLVG